MQPALRRSETLRVEGASTQRVDGEIIASPPQPFKEKAIPLFEANGIEQAPAAATGDERRRGLVVSL